MAEEKLILHILIGSLRVGVENRRWLEVVWGAVEWGKRSRETLGDYGNNPWWLGAGW